MVLRMANPTRTKNGTYYFIQRVPADLISKVGTKVYSFSLKTKDPAEARSKFLVEAARIEREHTALRSAPAPIPYRTIVALAGQADNEFTQSLSDEPGESSIWAAYQGLMDQIQAACVIGKKRTAEALNRVSSRNPFILCMLLR